MKIVSKVLVPNKEWIIETDNGKLGSIAKHKKGYLFLQKGKKISLKNVKDVKEQFGFNPFESLAFVKSKQETTLESIYDYPCSSKPHAPIFNIKKRLPIFSKSAKSKSQYCAGYYIIKFRKGWVKSFCPKLITLERYPYHGPFRNETESKIMLNKINQSHLEHNEKTQHFTD